MYHAKVNLAATADTHSAAIQAAIDAAKARPAGKVYIPVLVSVSNQSFVDIRGGSATGNFSAGLIRDSFSSISEVGTVRWPLGRVVSSNGFSKQFGVDADGKITPFKRSTTFFVNATAIVAIDASYHPMAGQDITLMAFGRPIILSNAGADSTTDLNLRGWGPTLVLP